MFEFVLNGRRYRDYCRGAKTGKLAITTAKPVETAVRAAAQDGNLAKLEPVATSRYAPRRSRKYIANSRLWGHAALRHYLRSLSHQQPSSCPGVISPSLAPHIYMERPPVAFSIGIEGECSESAKAAAMEAALGVAHPKQRSEVCQVASEAFVAAIATSQGRRSGSTGWGTSNGQEYWGGGTGAESLLLIGASVTLGSDTTLSGPICQSPSLADRQAEWWPRSPQAGSLEMHDGCAVLGRPSEGRCTIVTAEMLELLDSLGMNQSDPGDRTLAEHFEGTRALLAELGSAPEVCLAGLFHGVYAEGDTGRARDANLSRRDEVRAVIGPAAEELAYLYNSIDRPHLFGNANRDGEYTVNDVFVKSDIPVPETTLRRLFEIEAANYIEGPPSRFDAISDDDFAYYCAAWESARRFVDERVYAAVTERHAAVARWRRSA